MGFSGFQWVSADFSGFRPGFARALAAFQTTPTPPFRGFVLAVCAPATPWVIWGAPLGAGLLTAHYPPRSWLRVCVPSKKEKGEFYHAASDGRVAAYNGGAAAAALAMSERARQRERGASQRASKRARKAEWSEAKRSNDANDALPQENITPRE